MHFEKIFPFNIPNKRTYNIYDIIVTSLRHVSALQCHLQEVNSKITSICSKTEYIHKNFDIL